MQVKLLCIRIQRGAEDERIGKLAADQCRTVTGENLIGSRIEVIDRAQRVGGDHAVADRLQRHQCALSLLRQGALAIFDLQLRAVAHHAQKERQTEKQDSA